jgi:hypothetical protein
MPPASKVLGMMIPIGGGDPIPLLRQELTVGRRPGCDIRLDFDNVSGKHCVLRIINGIWNIRDLGSTNGTSVNGSRISSEHSVMPDDEFGISGRLYRIDYEPSGPTSFTDTHDLLGDEVIEERKRHSLVELAGFDTDESRPAAYSRPARPQRTIDRVATSRAEADDSIKPTYRLAKPKSKKEETDDFLNLIEEDIKKPGGPT